MNFVKSPYFDDKRIHMIYWDLILLDDSIWRIEKKWKENINIACSWQTIIHRKILSIPLLELIKDNFDWFMKSLLNDLQGVHKMDGSNVLTCDRVIMIQLNRSITSP